MGKWKSELAEKEPVFENMRRNAAYSETHFREGVFDIHLFITHTFEKSTSWDFAVGKYKDYFKFVSWLPAIGEHVKWFGVGGIQETRYSNLGGKVPHFHSFVGIDGGLKGIGLNPDGSINMKDWLILKSVLELKWAHGIVHVEPYKYRGGAITYGLNDHEFFYEGIGCPRKAHKCRKNACKHGLQGIEVNGRFQDHTN